MKLKSIKRRFYLFLVNHVFRGTRYFEIKRKLLNSVGYTVGKGTKVVAPITCTGRLSVGKNCWIGTNLTVHGNGTVRIGDNCDLAPDVTFLTGGHRIGAPERRAGAGELYEIYVSNGVWLGARSTILGNTSIGDGSVVAACACVTRDVPANTLVGGVPAKIIKEL